MYEAALRTAEGGPKMKQSPDVSGRLPMSDFTGGIYFGFDLRSLGLLFSVGGAVPLPLLALVDPGLVVPGALPWLSGIWFYSVLSFIVVVRARPAVSDCTFIALSSGGMFGIGLASFLVADAPAASVILCLNAAIPALAAMQSRAVVVVAFQVGALFFIVAHAASERDEPAVALVRFGVATLATLFPTLIVLGFRRSLEHLLRVQIELGRIDPLTGVFNRRGLSDHAARLLASNQKVGLLAIDIDNFKSINDVNGHAHGDEVLVRTASRLVSLAGPDAVTARLGGEEFLIVTPVDQLESIEQLAEQIRIAIACDGEVTVSIGAVMHPTPVLGPETLTCSADVGANKPVALFDDLIKSADRQMYAAKQAGRNRVVVEYAIDQA